MAPPNPRPIILEYNVSSNDVLSEELRVNVTCTRTGRVLWYQDRQLGEHEILEGIYDDRASLRWVIHRPKRGWYIRLRSPAFPPGTFIVLSPPGTTTDPRQVAAAAGWLEFGCRTTSWPPVQAPVNKSVDKRGSVSEQSDMTSISSEHSYPPSVSNSPSSSSHTLVTHPQTQITRFTLKPSEHNPKTSLLWRALSRLRQSMSFVLVPSELSVNPAGDVDDEYGAHLLSFTEGASSSFATSSGVISINETLAIQMGVDKSFWIAIALAYWEFLNERESYIASLEG